MLGKYEGAQSVSISTLPTIPDASYHVKFVGLRAPRAPKRQPVAHQGMPLIPLLPSSDGGGGGKSGRGTSRAPSLSPPLSQALSSSLVGSGTGTGIDSAGFEGAVWSAAELADALVWL